MKPYYYEQVHMALHGCPCPRSLISDGVDIGGGPESVDPALIKSLAGEDALNEALERRTWGISKNAVTFGVNKDLQHGFYISSDNSDGMCYVMHHPTGAVLKIPSSSIKDRVIPYPGLRDKFNSLIESISKDKLDPNDLPPSAEWNGQRVFTQRRYHSFAYEGTVYALIECRTESALYHGHDHVVFVTLDALVF